jgi:hypothetical protein
MKNNFSEKCTQNSNKKVVINERIKNTMSKSLLQKIKEEGRYVRFDVDKGFIYTINDESYYAFSRNGLTRIEE